MITIPKKEIDNEKFPFSSSMELFSAFPAPSCSKMNNKLPSQKIFSRISILWLEKLFLINDGGGLENSPSVFFESTILDGNANLYKSCL